MRLVVRKQGFAEKMGLFVLMVSCAFSAVGQSVVISEVMSDNTTKTNVVQDADGDTPDWIELYNTSDDPVDLYGWNLTDDGTDLTQWTFPATNLPAKGFLMVFASDKNRAVAGSELHANFKLSASGEYLALTRPDGITVENDLDIPTLERDVSFGYGFTTTGSAITLLDQGTTGEVLVPNGPVAGWNTFGFNAAAWTGGPMGVGYDANISAVDYNPLIGVNVLSMRYSRSSVYIRVPFSVASPDEVSDFKLKMKYDDAFVAYINGEEVARSEHAPAVPVWSSDADGQYVNDSDALEFQEFDLTGYTDALREGANVLAIQGINQSTGSSDLLIMPKLEATMGAEIDLSGRGHLTASTPGRFNATIGYDGLVDTPVVSPARGFYDSVVQVTVSNSTAGATVRYTLDGSEPTESSSVFPSSLNISSTKNLRVRAFKPGWKASWPRTDTYIFVADVVTQQQQTSSINGQSIKTGMDPSVVSDTHRDASNQLFAVQDALKAIPSVAITTDDDHLFDPTDGIYVNATILGLERPASMELIYPDGTKGFHVNAGIRIRGAASRSPGNPKHSFRLFFRGEYGDGKLNYPLFDDEGVDSFDKIDLRTAQNRNWVQQGGSTKNTFLRDVFSRDSSNEMGSTYTRSRYYHLYVNGLYYGLYMTEERPVADYGASYFGGDSDDYDTVKCVSNHETDPTLEHRQIEATDGNLEAYSNLWVKAMSGFADNADYFAVQGLDASGVRDPSKTKLVDLDNMIDYVMLIAFMDSMDNCISAWGQERDWGHAPDAILNNIYGVYNRVNPDGFKWFQHDTEWSMDSIWSDGPDFTPGTGDDNDYYGTTHRDRTGPFNHSHFTEFKWFNPMTLHDKLSVNAEYRLAFADRLYKHLEGEGALVLSNNIARIEVRQAQIDRAIVANAARWGSTSLDRDNWLTAVSQMKAWLNGRGATLISMYAADGLIPDVARPAISRSGGVVTAGATISISATQGTIYFTTDGSDPRAIGGATSGQLYSGSIAITRPTHVKARVFNDGSWSALTEATYWTEDIPLAVTELMYHAPEGNAHDFIEVKNVSDQTVSMKGYKLDNAVDFKFKNGPATLAAGEHMVVVDDLDAFASSYPTNGVLIAGEFKGDFSNNGEKVDLEFRNNDLISFTYNDARNWPQAADGAGHSLVPLDSAMDDQERGSLDYGGNWRASTFTNGSPGFADPTPGRTVVINEITAHTDTGLAPPNDSNDTIELFNPSASTINLSGWGLSDDRDDPTQFVIPNGTMISAGGFIVFDEDDFHLGRTNGFGLNKAGEQVYLFDPARGVMDAIRFKGQENGVAYGRYPDGAASWLITLLTPALANQPYGLPFRISELMYHPLPPAGDEMEYIVIENISDAAFPEPLSNATGTYRIDGGVSFTFPAGTFLSSGEKLWLVSFDPADTVQLAAFRSAYGLSGSDRVFGPYKGELSNRGERVALERPQDSDDPERPFDVSWVVVDELFYFDQGPWPASADGTGYPLVRTGLISWSAATTDDTDADGMKDAWEMDYFKSLDQENADWDNDGQSNLEEHIADSNPTNPASMFRVEEMSGATLYWTAKFGRSYSVFWTNDLDQPFVQIASGLSGGSHTDVPRPGPSFYRIAVELD